MLTQSAPTNSAASLFTVGQRVRVLPHVDAPTIDGCEGTVTSIPEAMAFGSGDYGVNVQLDKGFEWHFYSHRVESV